MSALHLRLTWVWLGAAGVIAACSSSSPGGTPAGSAGAAEAGQSVGGGAGSSASSGAGRDGSEAGTGAGVAGGDANGDAGSPSSDAGAGGESGSHSVPASGGTSGSGALAGSGGASGSGATAGSGGASGTSGSAGTSGSSGSLGAGGSSGSSGASGSSGSSGSGGGGAPPGCEVTGCAMGVCSSGACVAPVQVGASTAGSCAVLADGTVRCWGAGYYGQTGDNGSLGDAAQPVEIVGVSGAVEVVLGDGHVCARLSSGEIQCWANDSHGQLGIGLATTLLQTDPVTVKDIETATQLAAGPNHTCAVLQDGGIKCWGYNGYGQLGDGTETTRPSPISVNTITTAVQVSTSENHSCAVLSDKTARCWGDDTYGQLGDGNINVESDVPVVVGGASPLGNVLEVSTGEFFSCARLVGGAVDCWGLNQYDVLGISTSGKYPSPTATGVTTAVQLSSGLDHSCVRYSDGTVGCWGINSDGNLGSGTDTIISQHAGPLTVLNLSSASRLAVGGWHSCVTTTAQQVLCWGSDNHDELGFITKSGGPVAVQW